MANELTLSGRVSYSDSESADFGLSILELQKSVATRKFVHAKQNIGTSEEAIGLGELATLGWAIFVNRDATNYLEIRMSSGASNDHVRVPPSSFAVFHFGSDVTAPYAIANTAACQMEYMIVAQ